MGMAASQARYLALAARKTNIEYQGQQINQARLNLANQTATLFNQMLGINVPVPPSTQDFTINQYSFTDGINPAVIDKWEQLANPDTDGYNYVVEYHYDANVYTGFQKKMNDPQIQFSISVPTSVRSFNEREDIDKIYKAQTDVTDAQKAYDEKEAALTAAKTKAAKLATYRDLKTYNGDADVPAKCISNCRKIAGKDAYEVKLADGTPLMYYSYDEIIGVGDDTLKGGSFAISNGKLVRAGKTDTPITSDDTVYRNKYTGGYVTTIPTGDLNDNWEVVSGNPDIYIDEKGNFIDADKAIQSEKSKTLNTLAKGSLDASKINSGNFAIKANKLVPAGTESATSIPENGNVWYKAADDTYYAEYTEGATKIAGEDVTNPVYIYKDYKNDNLVRNLYSDSAHDNQKVYATTEDDKETLKKAINTWKGNGVTIDTSDIYYCPGNGSIVFERDLLNLKTSDTGRSGSSSALPIYNIAEDKAGDGYESIESMANTISTLTNDAQIALNDLKAKETVLETVNMPTFIGNTKLESLSELSQEEFAEIKQIISDMTKNGVDCNFVKCFKSSLNISEKDYSGGIYKFKRDGVTYYTTYYDLAETAYNSEFMNDIDNQPKLNYYHANYVTQPVYKTDKAILDTDSQGRFKTVRFAEDGAQYTLNFEQKTDDEAYQDAMNKYYYENAKYDKMIQDINAKTSIIQQEDRTLELKLKQLDTEQTALSNEMEAVQKVVKDGVEKGFKTFGG